MSRVSLTSLLALFALGCSDPRIDFAPLRPGVCEEEQVPCEGGHAWVEVTRDFEPRTLVYVIDTLSIPVADADGTVAGFDLDGMDSGAGTDAPEASCAEARADFVSSVDPNLSGVDNQLQMVVPTIEGLLNPADCPGGVAGGCLDATLQRAIDEGRQLLVIELSGIESFATDDRVDYALYLASPPSGGVILGSDGRLAPGQPFSGGTPISVGTGTILAGRFEVTSTRFSFTLEPGGFTLPLDLVEAQVRFDLGEDGLQRGVVGGLHPAPRDSSFGECSVMRGLVDGSVDGAECCVAPGMCCNAVSTGFTFTATRAELLP